MTTYDYITRWELAKALKKSVPLTSAQRIALDQFLRTQTLQALGRKRAIICLLKQGIADMEQREEAA